MVNNEYDETIPYYRMFSFYKEGILDASFLKVQLIDLDLSIVRDIPNPHLKKAQFSKSTNQRNSLS